MSTEHQKKRVKILPLLLAIAVLIGTSAAFWTVALEEADAASTHKFTRNYISGGGDITSHFKINGCDGLCQKQGPHSAGSGKAKMKKLSNTAKRARLAYWYGYKKGWKSGANGCKLARAFNYYYTGRAYMWSASTFKNMLKTAKKHKVPDGFVCYECFPNDGSQGFIAWKMLPDGKCKVKKKSSKASWANLSGYTFKGITFALYKSDKKTKAGTLTCKADGTTNKVSVAPGTYYLKETSVGSSGYKLKTGWEKVKISSGKTKTVTMTDTPEPAAFSLKKVVTGSGGKVSGFNFVLKNLENGAVYNRTSDSAGKISVTGIPAGRYQVSEVLTKQQKLDGYESVTKTQNITLAPGKTSSVTWTNNHDEYTPDEPLSLKVFKETEDGSPVAGFKFRIDAVAFNKETISSADILKAADPKFTETDFDWDAFETKYRNDHPDTPADWDPKNEYKYEADTSWSVETGDIDKLNSAAAAGKTGEYEVTLVGRIEGRLVDIKQDDDGKLDNPVTLDPVITKQKAKVTLTAKGKEDKPSSSPTIKSKTAKEFEDEKDKLFQGKYNDFTWNGAAYTESWEKTTPDSGVISLKDIPEGRYTVKEILTEEQKLKYFEPAEQTANITEGSTNIFVFTFENKVKVYPVKLKKSSPDGKVEGIAFTLKGTSYAKGSGGTTAVEKSAVTDSNGELDFGDVYPGEYKVIETGFDSANYILPSKYKVLENEDGTKLPYQDLVIPADAEKGSVFDVEFKNKPVTYLVLSKTDGETKNFLDGAEFDIRNSNGETVVSFVIEKDENNAMKAVIKSGDADITGGYYSDMENEVNNTNEDENSGDADEGSQDPDEDGSGVIQDALNDAAPQNTNQTTSNDDSDSDIKADDCSGKVIIKGLDVGEKYTLVETKAPKG